MERIEQYVKGWMRHRAVLHEMLAVIGEEHIQFKPWDKAFTLGSLAVHIVVTTDMFVMAVKNDQFVPSHLPQFETMKDVRRIAAELTEKTRADLISLSDRELDRLYEFNKFTASGQVWLETARDHEIHHKGQLYTYARIAGIESLPFFAVQPPKS